MKTRSIASALALVLPLAASAGVHAQGTQAQREACSGDAFRLCASSLPNPDKTAACLHRERERLSPACRAVFAAAEGGGQGTGASTAAAKPEPGPGSKSEPSKSEPSRPEPKSAARAAPPAGSPPPAVARSAEAKPAEAKSAEAKPAPRRREALRFTPRPAPAGRDAARSVKRTRTAARPAQSATARRDASDFAQANYWMKRVTGVSIAGLQGLIPR